MQKEPRNRISGTRVSGTRRNLGLRSVRSGTRWLAAGAAALTGTFTVFAAHSTIDAAKLRRTSSNGSTPTSPTTTSPSATDPSTTSPSTDDGGSSASNGASSNSSNDGSQWSYQAPVQPPVQTTQPPVASSGGT